MPVRKRTVIVLGAGASSEYGFPLGDRLVANIVGSEGPGIERHVQKLGIGVPFLEEFRQALRFAHPASIDAFLGIRLDEFRAVGSLAIAGQLLYSEALSVPQLFESGKPTAYRFVLDALDATTLDDLARNCLAIITFNYDRSFEHYAVTALCSRLGAKPEETWTALQAAVPIVHVHGSLGPLPFADATWNLPYGVGEPSPLDLRESARQIVILREGSPDSPGFMRARELLRDSERVIFLGFAFHSLNVERLGGRPVFANKHLISTAYHLTERERGMVTSRIGYRLEFGGSDDGCLSVLRELVPNLGE